MNKIKYLLQPLELNATEEEHMKDKWSSCGINKNYRTPNLIALLKFETYLTHNDHNKKHFPYLVSTPTPLHSLHILFEKTEEAPLVNV